MAEVLTQPTSTALASRLPEYEERIARVRAMRQAGALGEKSAAPMPVMITRTVPGMTFREEDTRMPAGVVESTTQVGGKTRGAQAAASPSALAAPVDDTMEFARRAERLGAKYASYQSTLAELDALRQQYEAQKKSMQGTEDPELRKKLREEDILVPAADLTEAELAAGGVPRMERRKRTAAEVDAMLRARPGGAQTELDTKLKDVARRTQAARYGALQTAADLKQFGFEDQADIERTFGD
jgi:hypothetical protein